MQGDVIEFEVVGGFAIGFFGFPDGVVFGFSEGGSFWF